MSLLRIVFVFVLLGPLSCGKRATGPSRADRDNVLSQTIALADWGIAHPRDIAYVELGILKFKTEQRLVVYDVRRAVPTVRAVPVRAQKPDMKDGVYLISRFNYGNRNALGGYFSAFAKAPCEADLVLGNTPDNKRGLKFRFDKRADGFAGFWVHLFDFKAPERVFLDARDVPFLTFRIRGKKGGESLRLQVADKRWNEKGDSVQVADVAEFLSKRRVTKRWQRAVVPLDRLPPGIDRGELAAVVFVVSKQSRGNVYIKDMALTSAAHTPLPNAPPAKVLKRPLRTALWVWETEPIAESDNRIDAFVAFCQKQHITDVFLQIPRSGPSTLRDIVERLNDANIRVDALDGDPHYALEAHHPKVLDGIRRVVDYNAAVPKRARFSGVRYDNEPYLIKGFGGVKRAPVLRQYLSLLDKIKAVTAPANLAFGVDIPFWFDSKNRFNEPTSEIDGKILSEWIIDKVDNLAIMDYRTFAYGPDGVVAHGLDELEYASAKGKDVFIGLETVYLPDETVLAFSKDGAGGHIVLTDFDGASVRVVWQPEGPTEESPGDIKTLGEIYRAVAPASKITFDTFPPERLHQVMRETARELLPYKRFAGFAIHSYESYRPWLSASQP